MIVLLCIESTSMYSCENADSLCLVCWRCSTTVQMNVRVREWCANECFAQCIRSLWPYLLCICGQKQTHQSVTASAASRFFAWFRLSFVLGRCRVVADRATLQL